MTLYPDAGAVASFICVFTSLVKEADKIYIYSTPTVLFFLCFWHVGDL